MSRGAQGSARSAATSPGPSRSRSERSQPKVRFASSSERSVRVMTSLPPPLLLFEVPTYWLVPESAPRNLFDTRLIGAAMLIGVIAAALTAPSKAGATARVWDSIRVLGYRPRGGAVG